MKLAMNILFVFLVGLSLAGSDDDRKKKKKHPKRKCKHTEEQFSCVEFVRNYDGDTITVNIKKVHPLFGKNINVRVMGIDTPEIRSATQCERLAAIKAKDVVTQLLVNAKTIHLTKVGRDKYFRILATVVVDGMVMGDFLIEQKLAVPYFGGKKPDTDWCAFIYTKNIYNRLNFRK